MIVVRDVHKYYGDLHVLKGVDMEVQKGEVIGIVGASGAGKTTLLQILGTLDRADKGSIQFNGKEIAGLQGKKLAEFRNRNIGFVFQFHHLLPEFSALENVAIPGFIANHRPGELSGGEQQRVAVARALINDPAVIFADEPSGNLDSTNAKQLHQLFFELSKQDNQTFVIVTHNEELAQMAHRKLVMKDGKMV
jgi:lipoprotein-releasing system ATP-binding protein